MCAVTVCDVSCHGYLIPCPLDILPRDVFVQSLTSVGVAEETAMKWEPVWSVKYTSQIKTRNILGHRGFIVGARRQ